MKAESQSLKRIFQGSVRYEIPLYQRPYVWEHREDNPEKDRLGPFWQDVKETIDRLVEHRRLVRRAGDPNKVAPMTPHFFGAVVVGEPATTSGGIVAQEVIDGQQRLTTSQILLAAATTLCTDLDRTKHASRLRKLWQQDDDVDVEVDDALKLRPTRHDRDNFFEAMRSSKDNATSDRINRAQQYFASCLREWANELPIDSEDEYFDALRDALYDQLLFVVIELQPGDNPQGIFESLNAQGERLLAIDLVKNLIFRRGKTSGLDLDKLDRTVWHATFGDAWWRETVSQGRYQRPRAELFLMHWLTERTNSDISATGLFVEFSSHLSAETADPQSLAKFIEAFVADAVTYRGFDHLSVDSRERLFFSRRQTLDVGVVYPLALRLWRYLNSGRISQTDLRSALSAIESWLVRRMTLRLTTKNYNRIVLELLRSMDKATDPVQAMIGHLKAFDEDAASGWWPSDAAFADQLCNKNLYRWIPQARVRMLLSAVEAQMLSTKTEKLGLPSGLTIEHVIPQDWTRTWQLTDPEDSSAVIRRAERIHRLGNLTLVTSSLNPALSNDPWGSKRSELAKHSALRLNASLVNSYEEIFDESDIDTRGAMMAGLLIKEWPRDEPSEN